MHCGVCGKPVDGPAIRGQSGVIVCATCVDRYGFGSFGINDRADKCSSCGYIFLPGWAPWYFTLGDNISTSPMRKASDPNPTCPACGGEIIYKIRK